MPGTPEGLPERLRERIRRLQSKSRGEPRERPVPEAGQESVWDYPRPPRLEEDDRPVRVELEGVTLAETRRAIRILETASPPTFYLPPEDVRTDLLEPSGRRTLCEWKGRARYWTARIGERVVPDVAWTYPEPWPPFEAIAGYVSFYPGRVDGAWVGDAAVRPQPGDFYGGWITPEILGPFKGEPGSGGW